MIYQEGNFKKSNLLYFCLHLSEKGLIFAGKFSLLDYGTERGYEIKAQCT